MRTRYRLAPKGRKEPTEAEVDRYRDLGRLQYNYHLAVKRWHRRPLYRDPKAFMALLLILLITWLLTEAVRKEPVQEQVVPEERPHKEAADRRWP